MAFAAVAIGALVPAAIMPIAAANLFARNVYKEYLRPAAGPAEEAQVSKLASLVVKLGALGVILFINPQFAIDLQLIGGVIILQTLPTVAVGLYTRWMHAWALTGGLVAGLATGLIMLYQVPNPNNGKLHFGGSAYKLSEFGFDTQKQIYVGFVALLVNLVVTVLVSAVLRARRAVDLPDVTEPGDYWVDRAPDTPPPAAATEPAAGIAGPDPRG